MGILSRIFGRKSDDDSDFWPGVLSEVSRTDVTGRDTAQLESILNLLASYTASHGRRFYVELVFSGFEADPRPIDQIEDTVAWARLAEERHADLAFWLTPGSLLLHLLCLGNDCAERTPGGAIAIDTSGSALLRQASASGMAAYSRIVSAGMPSDRVLEVVAAEPSRAIEAIGAGRVQLGKHYTIGLPQE